MEKFLIDFVRGQLLTEALNKLKKIAKRGNFELIIKKEFVEESIKKHIDSIFNTITYASYKKGNKLLRDIYIEINIKEEGIINNDEITLKKIIENRENEVNSHIVLLGGPGAGKTTTVRNLCKNIVEGTINSNHRIPILINLKDISENESIYSVLTGSLGIVFHVKNVTTQKTSIIENKRIRQRIINSFLNDINAVIILDGLDEVEPKRIFSFHREIDELTRGLDDGLVILTSRLASLDYNFDYTKKYELRDLNDDQVNRFVRKWFKNESKSTSISFMNSLKNSRLYDFSFRPLTLAHLCAIYESSGKLHDSPKQIYRRLIELLNEEWDRQRDILKRKGYIKREEESNYSKFDSLDKYRFLSQLAYDLCVNVESSRVYNEYNEDDLFESYYRIHDNHNLPKDQGRRVIKEIEAQNGIIVSMGSDKYQFYHKSMQEYLAADFMVKMLQLPLKYINNEYVNISNELAIAVCLSANNTVTYMELVFEHLRNNFFSLQFIIEFLDRLEFEKPIIKKSIYIPLSFILIYNLLISNNELNVEEHNYIDFEYKYSSIIRNFKKNNNINTSFKDFKELFSIELAFGEVPEKLYKLVIPNEDNIIEYLINNGEESSYISYCEDLYISKTLYKNNFDSNA